MPGSWEIKEAKSVLCYILHTDVTTVAWAFGLRNLIIPGNLVPIAGMPYDHARNTAASICLNDGYEWLFSLDSDVIPPRDAIIKLLSRRKPIISGLYCRRSPPHGLPVMMKGGKWVTDYTPGSIVEVDWCGAGCLLIHRSVLESLPHQRPEAGKTYFDWRVDMRDVPGTDFNEKPPLSEDYTFCHAAKKHLGISTLVDTSVVCRHVGYAQATPGQYNPMETVPNT